MTNQPSYCPTCGEYMPLSVDETRRVHRCSGRTPPSWAPTLEQIRNLDTGTNSSEASR